MCVKVHKVGRHVQRASSRVLWEAVLNAINSGSPRNTDTSHPTQSTTQNQPKQLLSKLQQCLLNIILQCTMRTLYSILFLTTKPGGAWPLSKSHTNKNPRNNQGKVQDKLLIVFSWVGQGGSSKF